MMHNREDKMIKEFAQATIKLNSERNYDELLNLVLQSTLNVVYADYGVLYLLDKTKENLISHTQMTRTESEYSHNFNNIKLYSNGERNMENPVNYCLFSGEDLHISNVYKYTGFDVNEILSYDKVVKVKTLSISVLPLALEKSEILGVLLVINYRDPTTLNTIPLTKNKLKVLTSFSGQAAKAVDNYLLERKNKKLVVILSNSNDSLEKENIKLKRFIKKHNTYSNFIGSSIAMRKVFSLIQKITDSSATVLIHGDTGTGKELVAHALHYNSYRHEKPFVIQNCAALPDNLLESELFGYKKGAFSGAIKDKKGLIEQADGGSLFLDEIGDMPLGLQAKLLRVMQDKTVRQLGSSDSTGTLVDVRIITATHCDLQAKIDDGEFREDLYYRLSVFPIELPSLQERVEDIPELIQHFTTKMSEKYQKSIKGIAPNALKLLHEYHYPGNVRDLMNIVERSVLMADADGYIDEQHLPEELVKNSLVDHNFDTENTKLWNKVLQQHMMGNSSASLKEIVAKFEAGIIKVKLEQCQWNQTRAASELSIARRTIIDKMTRYGIGKSNVDTVSVEHSV